MHHTRGRRCFIQPSISEPPFPFPLSLLPARQLFGVQVISVIARLLRPSGAPLLLCLCLCLERMYQQYEKG